MSEDVGFWTPDRSSGGPYTELGNSGTGRRVSCSRRTCIIITLIVIIVYVVSVSIPASLLKKQKHDDASKTTAVPATTTLAPKAPKTKWNRYKLPETVKPQRYNLTLITDLATTAYTGTVEILLNVTKQTNFIVLHSAPEINITKVEYKHIQSTTYSEDGVILARNESLQQIELQLNKNLDINTQYYFKLTFESTLNDQLNGFYKSSYINAEKETVVIATTQFEPVHARRAFPCFDEPAMKAMFALNIARPNDWISLFNTELNHSVDLNNGKMMDYYGFSPKMSTYLVAFIIADFKATQPTTGGKNGIEIKIWTPPDLLPQASLAANVTGDILKKYEEFFGIAYPLNKLDLVAIPDFAAGAMENWGLITYRSQDLLYDEGVTSSSMKQRIVSVIAHELAHQWFGNLVTMNWWNELWLNEGFATYVGEFIGLDTISKKYDYKWKIEESFLMQFSVAQYYDSLHSTHPLSSPENETYNQSAIEAQFDGITYLKGASLIRMVYDYVGANNTQKALKNYLQKYKYKNARSEDLWNEFDKVATGKDIKNITTGWASQSGFPLIDVEITATQYKLEQYRFYLCPICNPSASTDAVWRTPIKYQTIDLTAKNISHPTYFVLEKQQGNISDVHPTLIRVNTHMTGFYIVKYQNMTTTRQIVSLLNSTATGITLSSVDKGNIINDIYYNFRAGNLDGDQEKPEDTAALLLEMIDKQRGSSDYLPYRFTLDLLGHLINLFQFESEDKVNIINPYTMKFLDMSGINITKKYIDSLEYLQKRLLLTRLSLAVRIQREDICNDFSALKDMIVLWTAKLMGNSTVDTSSIHTDLIGIVAECSVMVGENNVWLTLLSNYSSISSPSEKNIYRSALAATSNSQLLYRYLQISLNAEIFSRQDTALIISLVASNKHGTLLTWYFIQDKWDVLFERYGTSGSSLGRIVKTVKAFSSQYMQREVESFFTKREVGPAKRALAQSIEVIKSNVFCKKTYGDAIIQAMTPAI